jgi:hypothetical protein
MVRHAHCGGFRPLTFVVTTIGERSVDQLNAEGRPAVVAAGAQRPLMALFEMVGRGWVGLGTQCLVAGGAASETSIGPMVPIRRPLTASPSPRISGLASLTAKVVR